VKSSYLISLYAQRRTPAPLIAAALCLAALLPPAPPSYAQELAGVVVATATRVDYPLTIEALGTARANESVEIRPKITETVTSIRFSEGEQAKTGQILVTLSDTEMRADVAAARAALVESESQYARAEELFSSRLMSESELESLAARRDSDRAALDAAESRLSDTVIRAPFAGRIGLRRVSVGSLVAPSVIITTLDDTDPIKLDFEVPETALSRVEEGLPVNAHSAAWPESTFTGAVASIDTRVDPISRTVTVRALIPNRRQLLRPGMFLTVDVVRDEVTALVIPEQSIIPEQSRQFVMVVDDGGVVHRREVELGRRRPGQVEITRGLSEGERVVAEGTQKARPGDTVRIVGQIEVTP
jgi:membrane fusion protein (multidrug efflux system)